MEWSTSITQFYGRQQRQSCPRRFVVVQPKLPSMFGVDVPRLLKMELKLLAEHMVTISNTTQRSIFRACWTLGHTKSRISSKTHYLANGWERIRRAGQPALTWIKQMGIEFPVVLKNTEGATGGSAVTVAKSPQALVSGNKKRTSSKSGTHAYVIQEGLKGKEEFTLPCPLQGFMGC